MKIERTIRNEMSAEAAYEMTTSEQFQEDKCRGAGALSWDVRVQRSAAGAVVRTRRKLATEDFPPMVRSILPFGVTATETVRWGAWAPDGTRTGYLSVDFHGAPASMKGTITIVPDGPEASTVLIEVDFKAHVPLIGRSVESVAAPIVMSVIDADEASTKAWTAANGS